MKDSVDLKPTGRRIIWKAFVVFILGFLLISLLIFVPAGTLHFFNGWLFIAGLLVPMTFALFYLLIKDPELLEKRLNMKEKEKEQKKFVKWSRLLFIVAYVIPGLDYRFGWSHVPLWLVMVSLFTMVSGYAMFIIVMMQNTYASRVIEIQNEQKVIDTGLYSVVRHPMYLAASILYLSSALVLGSFYTLFAIAVIPFLLVFRIVNEEKVLIEGLPGYDKYMEKVKYRIIPFIW